MIIFSSNMIEGIKFQLKSLITNPLFWIVFLGFGLRIFYGFWFNLAKDPSVLVDDLDFISYANNILTQGIWVMDISKLYSNSHLIAPGYPMIVALLFYLFGQSYKVIIIFNAFISSLTILVVYLIGKEVFSKKVAIISALWSSLYVLFFISIPRVIKEDLTLLLFTLSIYFFIRDTKNKNISYFLALFALSFSFLIHVDERFFVYFPFFMISFIFFRDKDSIEISFKRPIIFFIIVAFVMTPWLIRNYIVYGERVVILTEQTARFTDKIFNYDPMLSEYGKKNNKFGNFQWQDSYAQKLINDEPLPGLNRGKRYLSLQRGVKNGVIPHKFSGIEGYVQSFIEHWRPMRFSGGYIGSGYRYAQPWSRLHNIGSILCFGFLMPFFLIGIFFVYRDRNKYGIFLLFLLIINTLLHVLLLAGKERYRIPVDAIYIIISAKAIHYIFLRKESILYLEKIDNYIKKLIPL